MDPKIGKHFIVEVAGISLSDNEKSQLEELQPAGIMFRKRNFVQDVEYENWFSKYHDLISELGEILDLERTILCIDHESYQIVRPPLPITRFPYAAKWHDKVSEVAAAMAVELKSLGINLSFAPVADINTNIDSPIIGDRAFGVDVKSVTSKVIEFSNALTQNGVLACAKHFPGHGDATADSHYELPIIDIDLETLRSRELIPFKEYIDLGFPAVLTGHIQFPQIDSQQVTFSKAFLIDILREELGFGGVVFADAFCMEPVRKTLDTSASTINALNAGIDFIPIVGPGVDLELTVRLAGSIKHNDLDQNLSEFSCARIDSFLDTLPRNEPHLLSESVLAKNAELARFIEKNESSSTLDLSKNIIAD